MNIFKLASLKRVLLFAFLFCLLHTSVNAQQRVKKVVVQAFWWDYWNNNFRFKWADYLTELAPRLKALGVDAIWIPPNLKNDGPGSVGYGPFDHYDLGDKNQKGETLSDTVRTRSGTKDELLRMIAVMHANGIEVIQDIVLNHQAGAGNRGGKGGRDYTAASAPYNDFASDYYKNFRYVCYATPHLDTSAADYWTRKGRWPKNLHNFYPNQNNNSVNTNDINTAYFGPDLAYENNSIGLSTNIPTSGNVTILGITKPYNNASQPSNYMAQNAKDWIVWYKKQTGADGFRWDAVKHFGFDVQRDLTYALKYQSSFANGGNSMFNVGEWVGTSSEVDYYASQMIKNGTPAESGVTNEQMSGGFDFGLRGYGPNGGIYSMVMSNGSFNMQNIPGSQQSTRYFDYPNGVRVYKTVPFVNSHDTYRPNLSTTGNFNGPLGGSGVWNTGSELGGNGQHIDPREPRFAAANAVIAAVDGNPCFFIEDVFDYFSMNKRWSHLPSNTDSLPLRKDVGNIMQCHQALKFKDGDYAVPTAATGTNSPVYASGNSGDHLVIERTGKALIGISDAYSSVANNSADQQVWVTADNTWPTGTILYDYSGAHGVAGTQIFSDRRVLIKTAPCGHTISGAFGHGYSIWAPYPAGTPATVQDLYNYIATTYTQPRAITTTQEWEMADDLGDSHCASLGQGGQLPANSTNQRVAGKIYVQSGTTVSYKLFPAVDNTNINISLWNLDGTKLSEASGNSTAASPISGSYVAAYTGWITIKVRNVNTSQPAQKVWANVTYTAPTTLNTRDSVNSAKTRVSIWTGNKGTSDITDCGNWEEGIIPTNSSIVIVPAYSIPAPSFPNSFAGRIIMPNNKQIKGATVNLSNLYTFNSATDGSFNATSVAPKNYVIKCSKNNDITKANGVTATDVLLIQRHILNTTKLNSAYKLIAADVTGDKNINATDILRIKRLILGTDTTFTSATKGNRLWEFVDSAYTFPDTTNPFPFKDSIVATATLNSNKVNQTFIGVRLGDVNYDWNPTVARGAHANPVKFIYEATISDNKIRIPFTVSNFNKLMATQYTLHFDNTKYEFAGIENDVLGLEYNDTKARQTGNISFIWTDRNATEKTITDGSAIFTLVLQAKSTKNISKEEITLNLNDDITSTEAVTTNFRSTGIELEKKQGIKEQFTVSPNPNNGNIKLVLNAKEDKKATVLVTDVSGKAILNKLIDAKKGSNSLQLNLNSNGKITAGIYIIKISGIEGEQVKKIIVE